MRVLITGGSGQIGTAVRRLGWAGVFAPMSTELDIGQANSVEAAFLAIRPDIVINAAGYTAVDRAEDEPALARQLNVDGPAHLAHACARYGSYLVHLSTDYVFDGAKAEPYLETDTPNPKSVYGKTKLDGELAALSICDRTCVIRFGWVFSETGQNFVKTILALARERDVLKVVDDQWGTPCSARAIANVIERVIDRYRTGDPLVGRYHFATAPRTNWFEFARAIVALGVECGLVSRKPDLQPISTQAFGARAARPANTVLDATRLQAALGFEAPDWRTELRLVIDRLAAPAIA